MQLTHAVNQFHPTSHPVWQRPLHAARTSVVVAHSSALISAGIASTLESLADCDVRVWTGTGGQQPSPALTDATQRPEPCAHAVHVLIGDSAQVARVLAQAGTAPAHWRGNAPTVVLVTSATDPVEQHRFGEEGVAAYLPVTSQAVEFVDTVRRLSAPSNPSRIGDGTRTVTRGGLAPGALRRVREHIEAHLAEKIELATLAAIAGLSECHFARAFKQSLGLPPHRYLLQLRCKVAADLISSGDAPLADVCLSVGFSDQSHFTRTFSDIVGETPGAFRRRHR